MGYFIVVTAFWERALHYLLRAVSTDEPYCEGIMLLIHLLLWVKQCAAVELGMKVKNKVFA
jgi:hypothetical protein